MAVGGLFLGSCPAHAELPPPLPQNTAAAVASPPTVPPADGQAVIDSLALDDAPCRSLVVLERKIKALTDRLIRLEQRIKQLERKEVPITSTNSLFDETGGGTDSIARSAAGIATPPTFGLRWWHWPDGRKIQATKHSSYVEAERVGGLVYSFKTCTNGVCTTDYYWVPLEANK